MTTAVVPADVIAYAPELTGNPLIQIYLDLAKTFVFENKWGVKYKPAVCLLTAHFLTLQLRLAGSAGPITQEAVGELSISYGAVSDKADELQATTYGTIYLQYRKTLTITPLVV